MWNSHGVCCLFPPPPPVLNNTHEMGDGCSWKGVCADESLPSLRNIKILFSQYRHPLSEVISNHFQSIYENDLRCGFPDMFPEHICSDSVQFLKIPHSFFHGISQKGQWHFPKIQQMVPVLLAATELSCPVYACSVNDQFWHHKRSPGKFLDKLAFFLCLALFIVFLFIISLFWLYGMGRQSSLHISKIKGMWI